MENSPPFFSRYPGRFINTGIHPVLLHALLFLIPVDIYIIGDWLGAGVQWALFRYQETSYGTNIIYIFMDWRYIVRGIIGGRSAIALRVWVLGASLLVLAFLIAIFREREVPVRVRGYLVLSGTILFLFSIIIQYGILLHGPAGMVIPLGIPVLLILGFVLAGGETEGCVREDPGNNDGEDLEY